MAKRKTGRPGVVGRELPGKVLKLGLKDLRFGKRVRIRGRYYQEIRDQNNKLRGRVPWYQRVRKDVRKLLEVELGVGTLAGRKRLGIEVRGWKVERFDSKTAEVLWSKLLWRGDGVPIGEPGGRVRGRRFGRTGKWLGRVFEELDPVGWMGIIDRLPRRLLEPDASNFRLRVTVLDREGKTHTVTDPTQRLIQSLVTPGQFREMLAEVCSLAARRFGYAGAVELLSVTMLMGGEAA